jgi:chaperonin GroES
MIATIVATGATTGAATNAAEPARVPLFQDHPMNVRPLHDRLVVRRLEDGEQTVGGIIIPDSAKEKPQRGTVIAVGSGTVRDDGTRVPPDVKPGDLILFGKYASQEITIDGEPLHIMRENEVLAVIQDAPTPNESS